MTSPAGTRHQDHLQPPALGRGADWASLTQLTLRLIRRGALILAGLVAGLSAIVVMQYRETFGDAAGVASLEVLAQNPAIRVLFGVPVALDSAGGFTVWRTGMFVAVAVATWGLLTATRVTRGEEQAGRWALLLSGRLRLPGLVGHHLAVLLATLIVMSVPLGAAIIIAGAGTRGAALYAAGIALVGMVFAGVGTLCAQLIGERRSAAGVAAALLGMGLLLRMVADGVDRLAWLAWLTPFGLLAQVEPYGADRVAPLAVLLAYVAGVSALVRLTSARRDVGSGLIVSHGSRPGRFGLLGSTSGFVVRRTVPAFLGWATGLGAYFLLIGLLARSLNDFLAANPRFAELAAQAGFAGLTTVQGYAATLFALLAIPLGLFAASRLSVDAADEAEGRLTLVFSRPLSRHRWAAVHLAVVTGACVGLALVAGLATWAGTMGAGASLKLPEAIAGTLNVATVALLCLAAAQVALGWAPRAVLPIGAIPAVGGFMLTVFSQTFDWPGWVGQMSPFAHLAPVPEASPNWQGAGGMLLVAGLLAGVGILGFARRDLRG